MKTEKQLTAVEWFYDEIKHIVPNDYVKKYEQAKDLEMKHLSQAFEDGEHNYFYSKKTGEDFESGIEYYNEKFKKDEQLVIGNSTTSTANSYPQGTTITNL